MRFFPLVIAAAIIGPAFGATVRIPNDESFATAEIPNNWRVQPQGEFVEATAPDAGVHVMLLPPEGRKVGESIGEAIRYIRRTGTITVKSDTLKRDKAKFKGRDMSILSWDAQENKQPINIRCYVVPISGKDTLLMLIWGSADAQHRHATTLTRIIDSLAAVAPEDKADHDR